MKYKFIYKVLYPIGFEMIKVAADYDTQVPYTEIKPLTLENAQSQYFDFVKGIWVEAATPESAAKLELLETLYESTTQQLDELKEKTTHQEEEITNTQMAVAEVYEHILGGIE